MSNVTRIHAQVCYIHHHDVYGEVQACGIYGQLHDGLEVEYIAIYMHACL